MMGNLKREEPRDNERVGEGKSAGVFGGAGSVDTPDPC